MMCFRALSSLLFLLLFATGWPACDDVVAQESQSVALEESEVQQNEDTISDPPPEALPHFAASEVLPSTSTGVGVTPPLSNVEELPSSSLWDYVPSWKSVAEIAVFAALGFAVWKYNQPIAWGDDTLPFMICWNENDMLGNYL